MNKFAKIYLVSCFVSCLICFVAYFVIWLLGCSGNKICRAFWNNISSQYHMSFLILARPWMTQKGYDEKMKQQQDRFAASFTEFLKAVGIVEAAKKEGYKEA